MDGTTYSGYHSFEKFGLLRTARPVISCPVIKNHKVDNPGGNGVIDLTTSLTGVPLYEKRTITESFLFPLNRKKWDSLLSELYQYFDGQSMMITTDTDPGYYWVGVPLISGVDKSNETHLKLNIISEVEPFKYERFSSAEDWEWDSFNFETGIIRDYRDIYVEGSLVLEIIGGKAPIIPTFKTSDVEDDMCVSYYDAALGKSISNVSIINGDTSDIIIREGVNKLEFTGTGYITVDYRGGIL